MLLTSYEATVLVNVYIFKNGERFVALFSPSDFQKTYTQDGVCLTELGLCQLQSLSASSGRRRRTKPKLRLRIINQNSVAVLQAPPDPQSEFTREGDMDDSRGRDTDRIASLRQVQNRGK